MSENSATIPSSTKNHLNDGKSISSSTTTPTTTPTTTKITDVNKAPEVVQKPSESITDGVVHTIPPLPQSVEMKNVHDGFQGEKTTSNEISKTAAVSSAKKGVQKESDTATLSSSSTSMTSKQPQVAVATLEIQNVEMKDVNNELQGEKTISTKSSKTVSTESSKTVSSSSSTTDKAPEVQQQSPNSCIHIKIVPSNFFHFY